MTPMCPLCPSSNIVLDERIKASALIELYNHMLNSDISSEFGNIQEICLHSCTGCGLKFFYPFLTGSEGFYEKLQKFDWYYLDEKDEYDFARQYIDEDDKVLEIGCGKGAFAKKIKAKHYTGLEISCRARSRAEEEGVHVLKETIEDHVKENPQAYDAVCSFQVLEHVSDVAGFLKNSIDCLKPEGVMIISVPSADTFLSHTTNSILNMPPHHVTQWPDKSLKAISNLFGLKLVRLEHEVLSDIHLAWYSSTVAMKALNKLFKKKTDLVDTSLFGRILGIVASKTGWFYSLGIQDKKMRPYGHSAMAVYRKPKGK